MNRRLLAAPPVLPAGRTPTGMPILWAEKKRKGEGLLKGCGS
ncbi:hypothetical protein AB0H67_27690 [Streptomyces phaeochromogenes]